MNNNSWLDDLTAETKPATSNAALPAETPDSPLDGLMTETEFYTAEKISYRQWRNMKRDGLAPTFMKIGSRLYVSPEARRRWRAEFAAKARAAATAAEAAKRNADHADREAA